MLPSSTQLHSSGRDDAEIVIVFPASDWWDGVAEGGAPMSYVLVTEVLTRVLKVGGYQPRAGLLALYASVEALDELREALNAHPRRSILFLGADLLHALTGNEKLKMGTVRGQVMPLEGIHVPVVPTYAPGAILAERGRFKIWAADIEQAVRVGCGGFAPDPGKTEFEVIDSPQRLDWLVAELLTTGLVACDIETTGLNPRTTKIVAIGFSWERNKTYIVRNDNLLHLAPAFADPTPRWIWHNGKFDTMFLQEIGLPARVDHDTLLLSYCLDEKPGTHGLKQLANDYLGAPDYEKGLAAYVKKHKIDSYGDIPEDILFPYLAMDCDYTLQLAQQFLPRVLAADDLRRLYQRILLPASTGLARIEANGIYVDRVKLEEARGALTTQKEEAAALLAGLAKLYWSRERYMTDMGAKSAPVVFNPAAWQQLQWILAEQQIYLKDTTKDSLLEYVDKSDFIRALLNYRKAAKALSTYVVAIDESIEADGRVHARYKIHGTVTGRLSSTEPNLQNIPRDKMLRGMFAAPVGRVLIEADYAQAELRCLAHLSGDAFLRGVYERGEDLHTQVAISLFGEGYTSEQRTFAKTINFGIAYGLSKFGLAKQIKVDIDVAERMIEDWYARMPQAKAYLETCRAAPFQNTVLTTPLGRRRRYGLITDENRAGIANEASNYAIQSIASDLMLLSALDIEPKLAQWGALLVNIVHDSVLVEAPDDPATIDAIARLMVTTMRRIPAEVLQATLPFDADAKYGSHWGLMKKWDE